MSREDLQFDTFFYLLENPGRRDIGLMGEQVQYRTNHFNLATYTNASGRKFNSVDEGYRDWLCRGRVEGLSYAKGRDTVLKIILKAKDEPELIEKWIDHHAAIVGLENLIIMDCGSTDPEYLQILERYRKDVLIFQYRRYYNDLHNTNANANIFGLLSKSCRYLTILDADEFLVALNDGAFSPSAVSRLLAKSELSVYAGTWINNLNAVGDADGTINWNVPFSLSISDDAIAAGTVAGKAVVRSDVIFPIRHLGHNLHVGDVVRHMSLESFGKVFIVHVKSLHTSIMRRRNLKHLHSKGVVPVEMVEESAVLEYLRKTIESGKEISQNARHNVNNYLSGQEIPTPVDPQTTDTTLLLSGIEMERLPHLERAVHKFDFSALFRKFKSKLL